MPLWYTYSMGIFDRLGDVLKSYLNDEDRRIFGRSRDSAPFGDPDLEAAYEELDAFLRHGSRNARNSTSGGRDWESPDSGIGRDDGAWGNPGSYSNTGRNGPRARWEAGDRRGSSGGPEGRDAFSRAAAGPPEELRPDFAELGLRFGASAGECKAAYKKLLNIHHPDRHAGHSGNMKKATEKSARINAAYDRIEKWRAGKGD
jgi:curved DNA-binding protein CbpA